MQLFSNDLMATLSIGFTSSVLSAQLPAQQTSTPEISSFLPEAPWPQLAPSDSSAQQVTGEHSQHSQPLSSAALEQESGGISGTVIDLYGDILPVPP
jgi:hypothetical protein